MALGVGTGNSVVTGAVTLLADVSGRVVPAVWPAVLVASGVVAIPSNVWEEPLVLDIVVTSSPAVVMTSWTDSNVVCDRFPGVDPSVVVTEAIGIGVVVAAGNIGTFWEGVETSPGSVVGASLVTGYTDVVTSVTSSLGTIVVIPVSSSTFVATAGSHAVSLILFVPGRQRQVLVSPR